MSSRWWPSAILVAPELARHAVEHAAAQARAQRAHRLAFGDHALHDAVGVLLDDAERHADARRGSRAARAPGKPGCFWSRFTATSSNGTGALLAQAQQHVEQRVAVLAARQAHHHLVARLDHREVGDRLAHQAAQALGELGALEIGLAGSTSVTIGLEVDAAAPVHGEDLAGHEGGVEEEVFYRAGDVLRAADALERRLRDDALALVGRRSARRRRATGSRPGPRRSRAPRARARARASA